MPPHHSCPAPEDPTYHKEYKIAQKREIESLLGAIKTSALIERASQLRFGIPAAILPFDRSGDGKWAMMGGNNYHVTIVFADGIEWIVRFRRTRASSPPPPLQDASVASEVATLQFLQSIAVPVPQVHDFALSKEASNDIGLGYIMMDKLQGKPLNIRNATPEHQRHLLDQLSEIYATISHHPFQSIGALCKPGASDLGGCLYEDFTSINSNGDIVPFGPFLKASDYRSACMSYILHQINTGQRYSDSEAEARLVYQFLLSELAEIDGEGYQTGPFYLKHLDDKGDHIMVDDDYNITGIIDWEWAQTVPKPEAFACPLFLLDVSRFFEGDNGLGLLENLYIEILSEKGLTELAALARNGRRYNRLATCVGAELDEYFNAPFGALKAALAGEEATRRG